MSAAPRDVREAMQAVRLRLSRERPYLAPALFRIGGPVAAALPAPTMAVDAAWRLYVDPRVLAEWAPDELRAVLEHEVWHLVLRHPSRAKARSIRAGSPEQRAWNLAVDAAVNAMLADEGASLPGRPVTACALGLPAGLTADEYYELLLQAEGGEGDGEGEGAGESGGAADMPAGGSCADGARRPWELPADSGGETGDAADAEADAAADAAPSAAETAQIARQVAEAVQASRPGRGHEALARWAASVLETPRVPWRRVLAGAVRASLADCAGMVDYSYRRPSRRQAGATVLLPSMRAPSPRVAVVVDTSGSMGRADLDAAMAEVSGVLRAAGTGGISLIACDAAAGRAQRLFRVQSARLVGGGGTDMGAGLEAAARLKPRPDVTIVLTDGHTGWPPTRPACGRVIVCMVARDAPAAPAWARVVEVEA